MIQPHVDGLSRKERAMELATMMSLWVHKPAEKIHATEGDMIERIINIADENKSRGLSDAFILLAAEELIEDEFHEAQFHMEALMPDHREELIKRAERMRKDRER